MPASDPTPYQRIMRAADKGRGVRLSAEEVQRLAFDDAIAMRAGLDDDPETITPSTEECQAQWETGG